jgi:hypothetical protein
MTKVYRSQCGIDPRVRDHLCAWHDKLPRLPGQSGSQSGPPIILSKGHPPVRLAVCNAILVIPDSSDTPGEKPG